MADNKNNASQSSNIRSGQAEDYGNVINHLLAQRLAGRAQLWPRSELVQPNEAGYFKPDSNLYRDTLKKDRRNGKELEYIHSTDAWLDQGLVALELFEKYSNVEEQGRLFSIAKDSLHASKEILAMRTSYFHAILTKGASMARQLADLVEAKAEAKHSQIPSDNYATVYKELSAKYIIETAKVMPKDRTANPKKGSE